MLNLCKPAFCCGCSACAAVCPVGAIEMKPDLNGFLHPTIDKHKCINCKRCEKACLVLKPKDPSLIKGVFAAQNVDVAVRQASSSGGIFSALASKILKRKGVVYGVRLTSDFASAEFCRVDNEVMMPALRGSKYLQAIVGNTFKQVKADLNNGRFVLFSGTPCQIAGLKGYLGKSYEGLYCVDVICHAVPSPLAWRSYLISNGTITELSFRNKDRGWRHFSMAYRRKNGASYLSFFGDDLFMRGFLAELYNRSSCNNCPVRGFDSGADITLGDFWGVENFHSQYREDDSGVSAVIVRTQKGDAFWNSIAPSCVYLSSTVDAVAAGNAALMHNPIAHRKRSGFFKKVQQQDFEGLVEMLLRPSFVVRARLKVGSLLRRMGLR